MAAAEKNGLNTISLGLVFYGILRRDISLRRLSSYLFFVFSIGFPEISRIAQAAMAFYLTIHAPRIFQSAYILDVFSNEFRRSVSQLFDEV